MNANTACALESGVCICEFPHECDGSGRVECIDGPCGCAGTCEAECEGCSECEKPEHPFTAFPRIGFPEQLQRLGFLDGSWGNDSCAKAICTLPDGRGVVCVWIDFDNPAHRETLGRKYLVMVYPDESMTNDGTRVVLETEVPEEMLLPPKAWSAWVASVKPQLAHLRHGMAMAGFRLPLTRPVTVTAKWYRERDQGDEDRFKVGTGDMLEAAGVVENDRLIHWSGECARLIDRERPRLELALEVAV